MTGLESRREAMGRPAGPLCRARTEGVMGYKPPKEIAKAGIVTGATKAKLSWDKALVAGFLAGAYIAIAGLLAITVSAGMPERIWGTLPTFFTGAVFALGLILVIIAGSELLTGNM